eukprot:2859103-Amphidinium_carterae.1
MHWFCVSSTTKRLSQLRSTVTAAGTLAQPSWELCGFVTLISSADRGMREYRRHLILLMARVG